MIPFVVPFTNTLAPIMGSPFWSVTVPLTVLVLVDFIVSWLFCLPTEMVLFFLLKYKLVWYCYMLKIFSNELLRALIEIRGAALQFPDHKRFVAGLFA